MSPTQSNRPAQAISQRARKVGETFSRQTSLATAGITNLASGTPDFPTPPHIVEAGQRALADGKTTYTPWAGIAPLREAIAEQMQRGKGITIDPASEILVTAGSQAAMLVVALAMFDVGDEILVPAPFYEEYRRDILLAGATMVPVPTYAERDFEVAVQDIERAITPRSKALILISPSNPTGGVIGRRTLEQIAELAQRHDLLVIWDELYERYVYDDFQHVSFATLPDMRERTIVINGFSKCYSMTGWRVGYLCGPAELIAAMAPIAHGMTICAPSVSQWAALAAITGPQEWFDDVLAEYDRRRRLYLAAFDDMGLQYGRPRGAYYIMPRVGELGLSSQEFATALYNEARVMVGGGGGATDPSNEGFVRCALTVPYEKLEQGLERIGDFVKHRRG